MTPPKRKSQETIYNPLDSCSGKHLTRDGGCPFDVWLYVLRLHVYHAIDRKSVIGPEEWLEYFEDNWTPYEAINQDMRE